MALNPLVFNAIEPVEGWLRAHSQRAREMERPNDPLAVLPTTVDLHLLTGHVVVVGYGRVGKRIVEVLRAAGRSVVVAEQHRELVEPLRQQGIPAVSGDASEAEVLVQAHVARARMLVIAVPEAFAARKMIELARTLRPAIEIVARAHGDEEAALLRREGAGEVFLGEQELAVAMTRHVSARLEIDPTRPTTH